MLKELPKLELGQTIIKLFSGIAPLLGLLGTVTGMIVTFQAITTFGTGDPKLMAGGISQALVTTVKVCWSPFLCSWRTTGWPRAPKPLCSCWMSKPQV